jgi:hypothetical protein
MDSRKLLAVNVFFRTHAWRETQLDNGLDFAPTFFRRSNPHQKMIKIGLNNDFGYVWARQSGYRVIKVGRLLEKNWLQSTCKKS